MRSERENDLSVTVLMPAYNAERYLSEAIASVLNQDYDSFELLVVDDGSSDNTPGILEEWTQRDRRLRVIRLADNGGITRALNYGVAAARGRFIARQDADDVCAPGRLRRQVEAIERDPNVVLVSAGFDLIDGEGRRIGRIMRLYPPEVTAFLLNFSNAVGGHGQVLFRRADVLKVGGYLESWELAEDYELWCRLSELGKIVTLPIIAMQQRQHGERLSITNSERQLRQTLAVTRTRLSKFLERPMSDEEAWSVGVIWRGLPMRANTETADAILTEAYRKFKRHDPDPEHLQKIRRTTAWRWTVSALKLARSGQHATAVRHILKSYRWHWSGPLSGAVTSYENFRKRRSESRLAAS